MIDNIVNFGIYVLDHIFSLAALYTLIASIFLGWLFTFIYNVYQQFKR